MCHRKKKYLQLNDKRDSHRAQGILVVEGKKREKNREKTKNFILMVSPPILVLCSALNTGHLLIENIITSSIQFSYTQEEEQSEGDGHTRTEGTHMHTQNNCNLIGV